jgi:hypothetical protein
MDILKNKPEEINQEDLKRYAFNGYYTVGQLLEYIQTKIASGELTHDSLVLSQRIEDVYFEKNGWGVVKKEGEHYHYCLNHNNKIEDGHYLNKEQYPKIKGDEPFLNKISEEEMENSKEQYHPIWCPVVYEGDKNLYLDLHY